MNKRLQKTFYILLFPIGILLLYPIFYFAKIIAPIFLKNPISFLKGLLEADLIVYIVIFSIFSFFGSISGSCFYLSITKKKKTPKAFPLIFIFSLVAIAIVFIISWPI